MVTWQQEKTGKCNRGRSSNSSRDMWKVLHIQLLLSTLYSNISIQLFYHIHSNTGTFMSNKHTLYLLACSSEGLSLNLASSSNSTDIGILIWKTTSISHDLRSETSKSYNCITAPLFYANIFISVWKDKKKKKDSVSHVAFTHEWQK